MKKKILKDFELTEISGVDRPAQPTALAPIMKRHDVAADAILKYYGDSPVKATDFSEFLSRNENPKKMWEARKELFPLLQALNDSIDSVLSDETVSMPEKLPRIESNVDEFLSAVREKMPDIQEELAKFFEDLTAETLGNPLAKSKENEMAEEKTVEGLTKSLDEMTAKLEKAETLAKMSDAEKAHMAKMSDEEKASFVALSPADRAKELEKVKKNDETVTVEGKTVAKSAVGEEKFAVLKRLADAEVEIARVRDEAEMAAFEKRAAFEFQFLPGTDAEKAHVLKAVAGLEDEVAKASLETIMKAANAENGKSFDAVGKKAAEVEKSAMEAYNTGLSEIMKRDAGITKTKAMEILANEKPEIIEAIR